MPNNLNERNIMTIFSTVIAEKPLIGFGLAGGGAVSGLLTWIGILGPIVGFVGAVIGLIAGIITLRIKLREWRDGRKP
jgi:hypothetical protein